MLFPVQVQITFRVSEYKEQPTRHCQFIQRTKLSSCEVPKVIFGLLPNISKKSLY